MHRARSESERQLHSRRRATWPRSSLRCLRFTLPPLILLAAGCATLGDGRGWGEDATIAPGWDRVGAAAVAAVKTPRFWGPLAAAAVLQVDGWDRHISNWARRSTPVFGSEQNAFTWSDRLRAASSYVYFASVLATPSGADSKQWVFDKLRGTLVGLAAIGATDEESSLLKNAAARERPNGADTQSMPSSHTSRSAVLTQLAERNVQSVDLPPAARTALEVALEGLTVATAWARVESGWHYPSDTLVGMSIGNFNGAFFHDAFMGLPQRTDGLSFAVTPVLGGAMLQFVYDF